jgi:hypothetical protein
VVSNSVLILTSGARPPSAAGKVRSAAQPPERSRRAVVKNWAVHAGHHVSADTWRPGGLVKPASPEWGRSEAKRLDGTDGRPTIARRDGPARCHARSSREAGRGSLIDGGAEVRGREAGERGGDARLDERMRGDARRLRNRIERSFSPKPYRGAELGGARADRRVLRSAPGGHASTPQKLIGWLRAWNLRLAA